MAQNFCRSSWVTVAITAGLGVTMSAEVAQAYATCDLAQGRQEILRSAIARGDAKLLVGEANDGISAAAPDGHQDIRWRVAGPDTAKPWAQDT